MNYKPKEKQILRKLGSIIRSLRSAQGLSQEDLGYNANLDRTYIGGIERGERNVTVLKIFKIASALHTTPKDIFKEWTDEEE